MTLRRICVYCGSRTGTDPQFAVAARTLGKLFVERGIELVFGGGSIGLMGVIADEVLAGGGHVTGVITRRLWEREVGHEKLSENRIVDSMHERKQTMVDLSDAFVILPGGYGSLDELFEIVTWKQLHIHARPVVLLNVAGYYDGLVTFLKNASQNGFIDAEQLELITMVNSPEDAMERLTS